MAGKEGGGDPDYEVETLGFLDTVLARSAKPQVGQSRFIGLWK